MASLTYKRYDFDSNLHPYERLAGGAGEEQMTDAEIPQNGAADPNVANKNKSVPLIQSPKQSLSNASDRLKGLCSRLPLFLKVAVVLLLFAVVALIIGIIVISAQLTKANKKLETLNRANASLDSMTISQNVTTKAPHENTSQGIVSKTTTTTGSTVTLTIPPKTVVTTVMPPTTTTISVSATETTNATTNTPSLAIKKFMEFPEKRLIADSEADNTPIVISSSDEVVKKALDIANNQKTKESNLPQQTAQMIASRDLQIKKSQSKNGKGDEEEHVIREKRTGSTGEWHENHGEKVISPRR